MVTTSPQTTSAASGRRSRCTPPTASRSSWNPRSPCSPRVSRPTSTAPDWTCSTRSPSKRSSPRTPALDFKRESLPTFAAGFKDRPDTTFGAITADVLAHFSPGFKRKDFVEVVQNNAWTSDAADIPSDSPWRHPRPMSPNAIDDLIARARLAAGTGLASLWLGQLFDIDALTAAAVIGREVTDVEVGTAVTITYPRHPIVMSSQAQTAQAALDGRLRLGLGVSHRELIERRFGYSFERPASHLREYLEVLNSLLHNGEVTTAAARSSRTPPASRATCRGARHPDARCRAGPGHASRHR